MEQSHPFSNGESSKSSSDPLQNPDALPKATAEFCEPLIDVMVSGISFAKHDDAEKWWTNAIGVLTEYPEIVVKTVTDVRTGIQNRVRRLPGNADLRQACNTEMESLRKRYEAEMRPERLRQKAEEERRLAEEKAKHLTADELKAKFGVNGSWLPSMHDPVREAARQRSEERNEAWNREYIEREYAMHGYRPALNKNGMPITLHLAKQLEAMGRLTLERL